MKRLALVFVGIAALFAVLGSVDLASWVDSLAPNAITESLAIALALFFGGGPSDVSHVGISVGNEQMVDAPHTGADVRVEAYGGGSDFVGATTVAQ